MATTVDAQDFGALATQMRQAPKAVRDAIKRESRAAIAEPLAGKIRAAAAGPWARVLVPGVKTRAGSGAEAVIVIGGARPKLSGGAGPRQVVYGTEFGGGKRLSPVLRYTRAGRRPGVVRGHRRFSTAQFRSNRREFIFPTLGRNADAVSHAYAEIVLDALEEAVSHG